MTAALFLKKLTSFQHTSELENNQRFFRYEGMESKFLGVRMSNIFALAKEFMQMPLTEISILLESELYEARVAAVSMMDFQARDKKTTTERKKNCSICIFQNTIA